MVLNPQLVDHSADIIFSVQVDRWLTMRPGADDGSRQHDRNVAVTSNTIVATNSGTIVATNSGTIVATNSE